MKNLVAILFISGGLMLFSGCKVFKKKCDCPKFSQQTEAPAYASVEE